mgnify:CR=1 FL=1
MASINFEQLKERSLEIRKRYHELELSHHGSEWTIEEDALAFLTDAGLVGRNVMWKQARWPKGNTEQELKQKDIQTLSHIHKQKKSKVIPYLIPSHKIRTFSMTPQHTIN